MIAKLAAVLKLFAFVCVTPPIMLLQWAVLVSGLGNPKILPQVYNKFLCKILSFTLIIEGKIPQGGLVIANHVSWTDILVFNSVGRVSLVAKKEVKTWPLFGALARLQNCIFVDRESRLSAKKSADEIAARLTSGDTLVLFPEATTHNGRSILPFKSSFLAAAETSKVPIYPATLIYQSQHGLPLTLRQRPNLAWYGEIALAPHFLALFMAGPIEAKLIFHDPVKPQDFINRKQATQYCQDLITQTLAENLHQSQKIR